MYSANPIRGFSSVILFLFSFIPSLTYSDPRISEAGLSCGAARNPNSSTFVHNFITNMESLSQLITAHQWGTFVTGASSGAPVYGLSECISDLSPTDCLLCFAQCRTKIPHCLPFISGRLYLDGCFVRYDNYSFFAETIDDKHDRVNCSSGMVYGESGRAEMLKNLEVVVNDVIRMAVDNEGFGVGKSGVDRKGVVYGLGQCWKSVDKEGCRACLEKAGREVKGCLPANEGRGLNAGCYLRYSTAKFFGDVKMVEGDSDVSRRTRVILLVTCSLFLFALLTLLGFFVGYRRLASKKQANKHVGRLYSAVDKSNLNFKYETLEKATDFFNTSRKLGQGGAGSVYKGILRDGRNVAVKRLFFNTRQWVDEFFNEVNLISGVQHKNLVKLLGCSIEGPESLLVYEYVPNKSLDHFLFDKQKTLSLSWQQRFDIIVGTAEGLAYLHEGSATKIIHRDIKSSNILLDENLQAKIADFGLARCVGADRTHLSTGIAGTLGYMAPEYLVRGQLTEKADVYSFGVLVLEIVCGRKNSVYIDESGSLLHTVWKHYKSNTLVETVEECLRDNFPPKLASDVLQIGLLCTQASVSLRPSMSEVVQMLTKKHYPIPSPMQPPFLNASVLDPNSSTNSTSIPFSSSPATTDGLMTPKSVLR